MFKNNSILFFVSTMWLLFCTYLIITNSPYRIIVYTCAAYTIFQAMLLIRAIRSRKKKTAIPTLRES